jgi:hypothetical protein
MGQSWNTCLALAQYLQKVTMLKAFLVVEHTFTLMDLLEQEGRAAK